MKVLPVLCTILVMTSLGKEAVRREEPKTRVGQSAASRLTRLSGDFVENRGQWDSPARFAVWKRSSSASIEPSAIRLELGQERASLALIFEGASPDATLVGEGQHAGRYNFFIGKDPARWRSEVPSFTGVRYRGLYPGIDLCVREEGERLEYDLLLAPGADLARFVVRVEGASALALAADGRLVLETAAGPISQTAPRTWELLPDGSKLPLESRFRCIDGQHYGFEVPARNAEHALVVDPGLEWCTYVGGDRRDVIIEVQRATDGTDDLIVVGDTQSLDFPTTVGRTMAPDNFLPFVARFDSTGSMLVYATLFGSPGIHGEFVNDMALDATSAPIIVGSTRSPDLPVTAGAFDTTYSGGTTNTDDCYVARFNASGSQLIFSTYIGVAPVPDASTPSGVRGGAEEAWRVALDPAGDIVVAGFTISPDFPTTPGAYDRTLSGGQDLFVARLSADGTQLTYSTLLGGDGGERVSDMVVDAFGFVTLTGYTGTDTGAPFPTTPDALRRDHAGANSTPRDAYLARLALTGVGAADLRYSTIFPGESDDETKGLALHPTDPELVTVVGHTRSYDFATTPGAFQRVMTSPRDWQSAFVSQFRFPAAGGGGLVWSTLLGGPGFQGATGVAHESGGDVIVAGFGGMDFPTTQGSYDRLGVSQDGFLARLGPDGRTLEYATIFGGNELEDGLRVLSLAPRSVIVSGWSESTDLITTPGAFDRVFGAAGNGDAWFAYDGFLARFTLERGNGADTTAPAPTLVSPAPGAVFAAPTDFSQTTVTFDWSDASDPSGVQVYQIEISPDPDFFLNRLNVAEWTVREPSVSEIDVTFSRFVGQQGPYSWRVRTLDGANNWSPWSAVRKFDLGQSPVPRISHAHLATVEVIGGSVVQGTVVLQDLPAPAGGFQIFLSSSNPAVASVPATVTVPAGADRANFTVTTRAVTRSTSALITVRDDGLPDTPTLWVDPPVPGAVALASVALSPTSVTGGSSSTGTVTLNRAAPAGGTLVMLASNHGAASVPASVSVGAGLTSAPFSVTTSVVTATATATISASAGGVTSTAALSVTAPPTPSTPSLLSPSSQATVAQPITFDWTDASNAVTYTIQIDNSQNFTAPLTRTQTVSGSTVTLTGLPAQQLWWRVRGTNSAGVNGPFSAGRRFTARAAPATPSLSAVSVSPISVVSGSGMTGTVALTSAAGSGGLVVNLSSSNAAVASVPASVTILSGATSATFAVTTTSVASSTPVTLTGTQGANTRTASLTVNPAPPPASLSSVSLNPTTVTGGSNSTGTATLTSAAPSGGVVVSLSSSNPSVTGVPGSVTVASGATSANFTVTTSAVASTTAVTITGTQGTNTRSATLTVNPQPTGPLPAPSMIAPANDARFSPGQTINFDWSDVAGAASYTLQIDDNNSFPSPFVLQQSVAASQLSTSTLPTLTMWWRVRAHDGAGNPGNWSAVRRVEVKN